MSYFPDHVGLLTKSAQKFNSRYLQNGLSDSFKKGKYLMCASCKLDRNNDSFLVSLVVHGSASSVDCGSTCFFSSFPLVLNHSKMSVDYSETTDC